MKINLKPIATLTSGVLLLFGALAQTSQAQLVASNEVSMPAVNNVAADALIIQSVVTGGSGSYLYTYDVSNPSSDSAAYVTSFTVDFNAAASGADTGPVTTPTDVTYENNGPNGVTWIFNHTDSIILPGESSTVSFSSQLPPILSNAQANGDPDPPAPWASVNANQLYVPHVTQIPEPPVAMLLGMGLLMPALRSNLFRMRNALK